MKGFTTEIVRRARRIIVRMGHARARGELLQLSDHILDDIGISRRLLEQGVDAWPWREDGATAAATKQATLDFKPAIAELRRYNDAELNELGIARSRIQTVVEKGREGIDSPYDAAA